ncbi:MATH domain and coiled-coil domain-containing protein [Cardamine amara subsp. amara]|uniref:MATH domain and coiled-coil domain-containing protein n=1 Tax=Cardamine amara subsp. amara TaxID=228776 RepID=A0ABD1A3Z3_CARAN
MENQVDNRFTWVIKNFSSLQTSRVISSDQFLIGGCKWRLVGYPEGYNKSHDYFSLFLQVADYTKLPPGWRRHARYLLVIVNQNPDKSSKRNESSKWFDQKVPGWGLSAMLPLTKLHAKDGGFLVNDELKIVALVNVLEVIGKLDVLDSEVPQETTQPLKKKKLVEDSEESSNLVNGTPPVNETMNVINGFQVLPSQVDIVRRIFEKHPDIALEFRPKNPHLRNAYMNFLLTLIETLCQSPGKLTNEDLVEADNALTYVKASGFKVDWLEKKLKEIREKKEDEETGQTRIQELEEGLKDLKEKRLEMETQLEKVKAKVLAARASLTLDDVV